MKKGLIGIISAAAMFICVLLGIFIGRNFTGNIINVSSVSQTADIDEPTAAAVSGVNINTADVQLLSSLPGIGAVLAQRIVDYRSENGPFTSVDELKNVEGIGDGKLEAILDYVTTGGTP